MFGRAGTKKDKPVKTQHQTDIGQARERLVYLEEKMAAHCATKMYLKIRSHTEKCLTRIRLDQKKKKTQNLSMMQLFYLLENDAFN